MYEAEKQIIAYFFLGSARIFLGFGSTKNPARLGSTILRLRLRLTDLHLWVP